MNGHPDHQFDARETDEDLRDLFRRTTPDPRPIDVEPLLSNLRQPHSPALRRRWFTIAAAAVALLVVAGSVGWSAGGLEARRESLKVEAALRGEIERLRAELTDDFSRALVATEEDILRTQVVQLKRIALLLRDEDRRHEARAKFARTPTSVVTGYHVDLEGE